jgi:hypothetical protein
MARDEIGRLLPGTVDAGRVPAVVAPAAEPDGTFCQGAPDGMIPTHFETTVYWTTTENASHG